MSRNNQWFKLIDTKYGGFLGYLKKYKKPVDSKLMMLGIWEKIGDPSQKELDDNQVRVEEFLKEVMNNGRI